MDINTSTGVCLSKMLPSHINNLAEAYSRIAEGKKSEEEVKDWNRKDDNPEGKKVDKKKVDKCTCESFYLKRLQAMNPVYAEQYRAIAEVLIGEGYESSRLLDNIIEALPKEVVGHEFRAALQAVNPRIYEDLHTAEKKQARAIAEFVDLSSWLNNNPKKAKEINLKPFLDKQAQKTGVGPLPRVAEPYTPPRPAAKVEPTKVTIPKADKPREDPFAPVKQPVKQPVAAKPVAPKPDPNADYKALQAKAKSAANAGDTKAASAATREAETLGQTKFKANFGANYGRRSGMTPNPLMSANPPKSKMTYKGRNPQMDGMPGSTLKNSYEVDGELVEGFPPVKGTLNPWEDPATGKSRIKMITDPKTGKPKEIKAPGDLKAHYEAEGEQIDEIAPALAAGAALGIGAAGLGLVRNLTKQKKAAESGQGNGGTLVDRLHQRKKALQGEELQLEGIRDKDPEKGTEERKERLEKKRGHSVDDHPEYKKEKDDDDSYLETNMKKRHENNEKARKEMASKKDDTVPRWMKDDFNLYDIILTYLDENGLMDSVEHAEAIMEQLTAEQIESIVEELLGEDPVQDYRDRRRAAENRSGARGPEFSHGPNPTGTKSRPTNSGTQSKPTNSGTQSRPTNKPDPATNKPTNSNRPNSSVSSPGYDTRRLGGYDLRRLSK